jgi:hypothetical protein
MKFKNQTAQIVPSSETSFVSKIIPSINRFLPEDCQIKSRSDLFYATAIAFTCATLIFPPCLLGAIVCVIIANKNKKK